MDKYEKIIKLKEEKLLTREEEVNSWKMSEEEVDRLWKTRRKRKDRGDGENDRKQEAESQQESQDGKREAEGRTRMFQKEEDRKKGDADEGKTRHVLHKSLIEAKTTVEKTEDNCIYIDYILDTTLSFTRIFPEVYYVLENSMNLLKSKRREYKGIVLHYGLTVLGDQIQEDRFEKGAFTESEEEFLKHLRELNFQGGLDSGAEPVNEAILASLQKLGKNSPSSANRGIILITDSMPEDVRPDFRHVEGCRDKGLRFAVGFLYSNRYAPKFDLGNRYGEPEENDRNESGTFLEIRRLLSADGEKLLGKVILDIMRKVSVY